jgi:hypothetical protein
MKTILEIITTTAFITALILAMGYCETIANMI